MPVRSRQVDRFQRRCGQALLAALILLLAGLAGRLAQINTSLRPRLLTIAEQQQLGRTTTPARRGMILDSRGRVVATSRLVPDVFVDPALVEELDELAAALVIRVVRKSVVLG